MLYNYCLSTLQITYSLQIWAVKLRTVMKHIDTEPFSKNLGAASIFLGPES